MINLTDHNQKRYNFIEWDGESPITTPGGEFYLPVCGLPSRDYRYGDGWVVMGHALRFYGDESGSHGKGTYVIAGYMATAYNWEKFRVDWEAALAESPSIPYFHRGPNHHGDKPFDGWDGKAREAKLYRMIQVFEKFSKRIVELSSTITWSDYEAVKAAPLGKALSNPYYCCLHGVISLALQWVREKGEDAGIDFIFDYQFQHQAEAVKQFHTDPRRCPTPDCPRGCHSNRPPRALLCGRNR
jgi:hypothetical protein